MSTSVKQYFFDRKAVIDAIGIAEARNLAKIGAFIRRRARSLLRRRKTTASAGQPPHVHAEGNYATLKNIQFSYEKSRHAMVVGPIKIVSRASEIEGTATTVPQLMEFGGSIVALEERYKNSGGKPGMWFHRDTRYATKNSKEYRSRIARYAEHPFMGLALKMEINDGTIRDVWRASIGSGAMR